MPSRNFTASEVSAVADWIAAGGSLLVLGDNSGLTQQNANINYLLSPYNLRMNMTVSPAGPNFTVFQKHAICEGLSSIATSSPGAVNLTSPAYPIVGDIHGNTIVAGQIHGQGRILLQSDLNVFDHALISSGSNRQYSVNIINWLASGGTNVLLFTDEPDSTNYYRTPVADALNDLRVPFYLVFTASYLNFSLYSRAGAS